MKLVLNVLVLSVLSLTSISAFASSLSECEAEVEVTKVNPVRGGYSFEGTVKSTKTIGDQGSCDWMNGKPQSIAFNPGSPDDRTPPLDGLEVGGTVKLGVRVTAHEETGQDIEWMLPSQLKDGGEAQPPESQPTEPEAEKPATTPAVDVDEVKPAEAEKKSGGCATGGLGASGLLPLLFAMFVRVRR